MDRWYAYVDDKMYGPYVPEQLGEFVQPHTLICREGAEEWKPARDVPELSYLLGGFALGAPPNVGWLIRTSTGGADGPVSKSELMSRIESGMISGETLVKHTDWDDWMLLAQTKLIHAAAEAAHASAPGNPEDFSNIVRSSSNDELMKEYKDHYDAYDRRQKKILKEELLRRGLIKKWGMW